MKLFQKLFPDGIKINLASMIQNLGRVFKVNKGELLMPIEQLTKNFNIKEFNCKCGCEMPFEAIENTKELAIQLQVLRDTLGEPVKVISGYRCEDYNKEVGGVKKSQHLLGKAADISVNGWETRAIKDILSDLIFSKHILKGGIGLYRTFTHYDTRGRNARWYGAGIKP